MKNILPALLICLSLSSCGRYVSPEEKQAFADSMAEALQLTLISTDQNYTSPYLRIYNDTIMGFRSHVYDDSDGKYYEYYFVQSLKNPKFKAEMYNDSLPGYGGISYIDEIRDGRLYFGRFGHSTMQTLDLNSNLTEYFKKYRDTMFYANKIMLYQNKTVITSMNGVYVFDQKTQQLLWKYRYLERVNNGMSAVVGNKLVFTETAADSLRGLHTDVMCFDLDRMKTKWMVSLKNTATYVYDDMFKPRHQLQSDGNNLVLPQGEACYLLDLNTGVVRAKYPWAGAFRHDPMFDVENHILYFNNYKAHEALCVNLLDGKTIWRVKNASYSSLFKNHVTAIAYKSKSYLILNRATGQLEHRVVTPRGNQMDVDIFGNYVLINRQSIYR